MESAADFRTKAAMCRALATQARDDMTAKNLLALAKDYEARATQLGAVDAVAAPKPKLPTSE